MDEDVARDIRPGQGRIVSNTEAKLNMGRSFQRARHEGLKSNPTEWEASKRLANKPPTDNERKILFDENPSDVKTYKASGLSDEEIYNILKNR
ncbi:MAG: hypothetical protein HY044_04950 [Candidatus Woesebacteria bacterium]|nr:MAG: hypothetical protein HY044_04950 [Candidatus Woesebacteria bacterium]